MNVHCHLRGRTKQLCLVLVLGVVGLLAVPAMADEPDRLVRAFLGVSSIPVRFPPPKDKTCSYLAIAKFKEAKFLGYAELPFPGVERFLVDAGRPNYEAELGWAEKDGKYGFFLTTPGGSHAFREDEGEVDPKNWTVE